VSEFKWLYPEHLVLLYGSGGAGKSSLLAQMAVHVYKAFGLKTRIVGADGGGTKPFQVLMKKGIVEYWPIDLWDRDIWTTYDRATMGWWPEDINVPNSKLLPPYKEHNVCPFCGKFTVSVSACTSCKKPIPAGATMKVEREPQNRAETVGAYGFESIAALSFNVMQRLKETDTDGGLVIKDKESEAKISQSGQHHYGIAQNYIQKWVGNTRRLPTWAVVWTTLELRGGDDGYGKPVYGPALPGKKLTALCTPWFTDVMHLELEPEEKKNDDGTQNVRRVLYLADHFPPDTKPYGFKAKTSVPGMPLRIPAPVGKNAMETYFAEVTKAYERQEKELGVE
jgi:hypothetical protein